MIHVRSVVVLVFVVGCVSIDDEGEVGQQTGQWPLPDCESCGGNGLDRPDYDTIFGEMNRGALAKVCNASGVCAWDWGHDGPTSLCSASGPARCDMRDVWQTWLQGGLPQSRMRVMKEIVKCIAPRGYVVYDRQTQLPGAFGLRTSALLNQWDYRSQETITACLIAMLDPIEGVPLCLLNEENPDGCGTHSPAPTPFLESVVYGKHFRAPVAVISGGLNAKIPSKNQRYGKLNQAIPERPATEYEYDEGKCQLTGPPDRSYATSCRGPDDVVWNWPVTVRTPFAPKDFYYGDRRIERPESAPIPY